MRTKVKLKGGISLIVLVITIIVMIILAAAIILSLSNSGIISKANKAKTDSDVANLKEYVNTLRAEWELMTAEEQTAAGTFVDYANAKLAEKGYKRKLAIDGRTLMNEAATAAVDAGIKVGDTVNGYAVEKITYTTSGEENTAPNESETGPTPQTITTNTNITWKYMGINTDGEIEIVAMLPWEETVATNVQVTLSGKGGYLKGPEMLNIICEKLYSIKGVGIARSMNFDDVKSILGYTSTYTYSYGSFSITSATPLTVGELDRRFGTSIGENVTTPDGKKYSTYLVDLEGIYNIAYSNDIKNKENAELIGAGVHYNVGSWLASKSSGFGFEDSYSFFRVGKIYGKDVDGENMWVFVGEPSGISYSHTCAIRPVVKLDSSVKVEKDATAANTWNISK